MDDVPLCPPWWPRFLWDLHFPIGHRPGGPGGPVNYPPAIDDMMASLTMHTMSYLLLDQAAGQRIRALAERQLVDTAQKLSSLHGAGRQSFQTASESAE